MRLHRILPIAGLAFLASCAGNTPEPPQALATWKGGLLTPERWSAWKANSAPPGTPQDEVRVFQDYLRTELDAKAAEELGLMSDSLKAKRWASIEKRIMMDMINREYLRKQYGIPDSAITAWVSKQKDSVKALPSDTLRARAAHAILLEGANLDSVYKANLASFRKDSTHTLPKDSVKSQLEEMVVQARGQERMSAFVPNLRTRYNVQLIKAQRPAVPRDTLLAYWKSNPEAWMTNTIYKLAALGSRDSAKLAKARAQVKDQAGFQALAGQFPVGNPVAPAGLLGRVKSQFALPYGVGMIPELFPLLETIKVGSATPVFRYNDTIYMTAWLESKDTGSLKPFEKVESEVAKSYEANRPWTPSAKTALVTWDKGAMFTRGDVDFISEEIPANIKRQFPAERVLDFMINWEVNNRFAVESGLANRESFKSAAQDNRKVFWAQEFRSSRDAQMYYFTSAEANFALSSWKTRLGNMPVDSSNGVNRDGAKLALLGANDLDEAYKVGIDRFYVDSVLTPVDSARKTLFADLRPDLEARGRKRIDSIHKAKFELRLFPAAPQAVQYPAAIAYDSARANHDRRALGKAEELYREVETNASAPDSLRAQALFQIGQLFGEQQYYNKSLEAYRSVLQRFPKSGEAYKAQFMIAFTLSEYLKTEKRALVEYRTMLAKYPKSDLADDADWMIRNIESGGALMPKFDDSAFVADSVRRADSAAKATKASAPKVEAAKVAPAKKDSVKVVAPKKDTAKAVAPKAAAAKKDSVKVVPAKKDSVKVVAPKKDTAKAVAPKAAVVKKDSVKVAPAKKDTIKATAPKAVR
ncbi:MAG: hypothetical protein IPK50_18135 [Fibrobacterota bacterium]|nr:MAG: hypothetical protein IPK50_18135 [Fibrobacterota bacterium]